MADRPNARTSNYGWALWHLQEAGDKPGTPTEVAALHAQMAIARALLSITCDLGAARGVDPDGPTTWEGASDER